MRTLLVGAALRRPPGKSIVLQGAGGATPPLQGVCVTPTNSNLTMGLNSYDKRFVFTIAASSVCERVRKENSRFAARTRRDVNVKMKIILSFTICMLSGIGGECHGSDKCIGI